MIQNRIIMGMPVTVEVADPRATAQTIDDIFDYFGYVDRKFSTYKPDSEISMINRDEISLDQASEEMKSMFLLAEKTRQESNGYFQILRNGRYDPSGIVKGWAILQAADRLQSQGFENYYVDAGGDVQISGKNDLGQDWRVGIQNPFNPMEIVKVLSLSNCGIATSGNYARGEHIYNPQQEEQDSPGIVSLTVVGPNVFDADRFATAAYAMGYAGINFIEDLEGFEGYMIDRDGIATYTSGFGRYVIND
jgi:thiamine biosynthesis lipoprotein